MIKNKSKRFILIHIMYFKKHEKYKLTLFMVKFPDFLHSKLLPMTTPAVKIIIFLIKLHVPS